MNRKLIGTIVLSVTLFHSDAIRADVVMEQLIQQGAAGSIALGQSLITPGGGPWNNLTFNWFDTGGTPNPGVPNPIATGTLFLLNQEYLDTPGTLSVATAGYIAQSQSITSGLYVFGPSVTLQPNTMYFFYTNQSVPNNSGDGNVIAGAAYGNLNGGSYLMLPGGADARFRLQGSVVPEPSALALCLLTIVSLFRARPVRG